jgi:hypothetical protein
MTMGLVSLLIVATILVCGATLSWAADSVTTPTTSEAEAETTLGTVTIDIPITEVGVTPTVVSSTDATTPVKDPCANPSAVASPACKLLEYAVRESLVDDAARGRLLTKLTAILNEDTPSTTFVWSIINTIRQEFTLMNVLYGVGAIIVVISGAVFITLAWDTFSGLAIVFIAGAYATAFAIGGYHLFFTSGYTVAGGILFMLSECMIPLCVHALLRFCRMDNQYDIPPPANHSFLHSSSICDCDVIVIVII